VNGVAVTTIALDFFGNDLSITPGAVARFSFTIDGPADVSVSAMSFDFHPLVALFGAARERVAGPSWGFETFLEAGTYHVAVTGVTDLGFAGDHTAAGCYALHVTAPRYRRRTRGILAPRRR
jgi:hypothetical protein